MEKTIEDKAKTTSISGKELAKFLNINPRKYRVLYPNIKEKGYCPGMDLSIHTSECQGMYTVMNALKIKEINGFETEEIEKFPAGIRRNDLGKYKSGEVYVDDVLNVAYLYLGKSSKDEDIVLNLGGNTKHKGNIQRGHINRKKDNDIFFDKKLFPRKQY